MARRKIARNADDLAADQPNRSTRVEVTPAMAASVATGRAVSPAALAGLQRTVGNAAVQRLATAGPVVQRDPKADARAEALLVAADMSRQFKSWRGLRRNRGAWWGSARPGDPAGAKNVPTAVAVALKPIAIERGWVQAPSFTGGVSFHKKKAKAECDFIYHMQAP